MDHDAAATILAAEHQATMRRLASLQSDHADIVAASLDSNADDEHDPEGSTIAFERSQVDALIEQTKRHLAEIEEAGTRLDRGVYGICLSCGRRIPSARLEARPTARTCIDCATRAVHPMSTRMPE
ncbi:TraR/DksA C4-type zinc finger protein [Aeromicrobium sp.]|uniref:TraR/DksA family transcriptional regulator n=1 Tax=Aeromicrobium sp. TaxID=1871063 RepID=UPI0019CB4E70|nr:TraR/DksA C4-type zinc finger protein [Aeromicrobium sp.]MBC7633139.1 TraR/DksA C4-type zinc finger protein [Aeromicrobium sp.]